MNLTEKKWREEFSNAIKLACLERIFIGIGIVAILLGLILSIWIKLDSEFQNLHKPAVNKNDYELLTVRSTLLRTDEEGFFNTSNWHEESVTFLDQTDTKEESNDVERFGLACLQCRLSFILAFS